MGTQLVIKKYINHELKKKKLTLDEEGQKQFNDLFSQNPNYDENHDNDLKKNYFRYIIQISNEENFRTIFKIFGEIKDNNEQIISLDSLRYLYYSFTSDNPRIKLILIAFLLFSGNESIDKDKLNTNICILFQNNSSMLKILLEFMSYFCLNQNSIKSKQKHKNNDGIKQIIIDINDFIKYFFVTQKYRELNEFIFLKKFIGQSELGQNKNNLNYYCDCSSKISKIDDRVVTMKKAFNDKTSNTNKALYFKDYEKMLKMNNIHINLIKLTVDFMKISTLKDYCVFEDIMYLFENLDFSSLINNKKKFLFKMISMINQNKAKLSYEEISKYLNIEEKGENKEIKNEINEKNNKLYDEIVFMNDNIFDDMIKKLNTSLENFGLLPYLEFKVKSEDKIIKKRLINDILRNNSIDNYENYLENEFEACEYFYAINKSFMDTLMDPNAEAPDFIDNENIAEEINIIKEEDRYRQLEAERVEKIMKEERKKREKKEKKTNNNNDKKKTNINEKEENNDHSNEKKINIETKNARLKPGLKYKKDFILLCGQLFTVINNNYQINYKIQIKKIQEIINLRKDQIQKSEKDKEKEQKDKEKNEETKENEGEFKKNELEIIDEEELAIKENIIKENLDKFIIDEEKGFITKVVKYDKNPQNTENEGIYFLNEIDFYPVKTYTKTFGILIREVEKAKKKYDELEKEKQFNEASEKEKRKIISKQNKEREAIQSRVQLFYEKKEKISLKRAKEIISEEMFNSRIKQLYEEFSDIFKPKEKTKNDYEVDITMSEFIDIMARYRNDIIIDNSNSIFQRQRYKTYKDMKRKIFMDNYQILNGKKFKIYYYYFSSKSLFIPGDDFCFQSEGNPYEPFVCIIVDIENDKGESFFNLLEKKEKEEQKKNPNKDNIKEKIKIKVNVEEKRKNLTEEEKKLEKERLKKEKLEREKIEKEQKEKEKEEKLKIKKIKEENEKKRKEYEKLRVQQEKEMRQREKEEQQKLKALQKEKEQELQRQKEREKYISPPYGIENYGNTCYFNSVNQIFLNLPILQQLFLDQRINFFINKFNKFGHQGKFFETFRNLYWIKNSKIGDNVKNLKKMVGKLKEDFNNNQQQDANEYLNFLLENLHEELNIHSSKKYIEEKDDIFGHNKNELGNISWSNNLQRNASFIDSIFMFQLQSNLKCRKCNTVKYKFETNYMFDLPLSLCKMVTVEIYLYKLPFNYKLYYAEINEKFRQYIEKEENKNNSIEQNLLNYYKNELTSEEKKNHSLILHFSFDLEREKTMIDIIKILKGIKPLELEPEKISEIYNNDEVKLYKIEHYTDLITYSKEKRKIIYPDQEIDKYVNIEDKIIINAYEVLNSYGMQKIFPNPNHKIDLYTADFLKNKPKSKDDIRNNLSKSPIGQKGSSNNYLKENIQENIEINSKKNCQEYNILSLKEKMIYLRKEEVTSIIKDSNYKFCLYEFALPIFHYKVSSKQSKYMFRTFFHSRINDFPVQYIALNNTYNISAINLYDYIWNLNKLYLNHPNRDINEFWWNNINKINENKNFEGKLCYPFVLRYLEIIDKNEDNPIEVIHCGICPWYSFCSGCIIDPSDDLTKLKSKCGIVVDWCTDFIEKEIFSSNFKLKKEIDSQIISENLPILDKEQHYQSINDCFKLFFVEENLEDPLFCHKCRGPESFSKKYSINKLPYVLILSLKRFKFNQNSNFKLRQMITYPLYNLELQDKKYDLYGVINHYGSISSGHYTAIIKNREQKWILCNDSSVYEIEEKRVMHSNAYILFYICKDSPYSFDYIKMMKSIMNNIVPIEEKNSKKLMVKNDQNFFLNEPVRIEFSNGYKCGYIMKENLEEKFDIKDNNNIYDNLRKEDQIRIDNIIKRDKEKDKEKNKDKKEENIINEEQKSESPKEELNNKEKNEIEIDKEKIGKVEINSDNRTEINEISTKSNEINELQNEEFKDDNDEKNNNKEILPDYYKNFVRVNLEFADGWINKKRVNKIITLEEKENSKK